MVSVGKLSAGQARYYLDQAGEPLSAAAALTSGAEDYYVGGHEAAGRWVGRGTRELGLAGHVGGDAFQHLLRGEAPTGETLRSRGTVAGFDVTFSAPKSVSVIFGIADMTTQAAVRGAHERAVAAAFDYFERSTAFARRGAGGAQVIPADGLVAAAFLHRTSRAGDPQLHTHVVVANLVRGADGAWSALDGRLIYAHARTAGFLYQAQLRHELTGSLGLSWTPVSKGSAEARGVSSRVIRAFSRRRAEIEAAMELHGSRGRDAAQVAALDTRRAKDRSRRPEDLAPEWRVRAARLGLTPERIATRRAVTHGPDWPSVFAALAAPSGLTEQQSSFTRRDVLQALCGAAGGGADVSELERAADTFLRSASVVPLLGHAGDHVEIRYSTVELLETERAAVGRSVALRSAGRGLATEAVTAAALGRHSHLSGEQRVMVERLTRGGDGVAVVIGVAGTGKTTALAAAREAWEASGVPVRGGAIARKAAHELQERGGIRATSVHALVQGRRPLERGTVLVLDEAGMLGTRQFAQLLKRVDAVQGKLVVVGDTRQLPAIEAGGILGALAARLPVVELLDNRRQQDAWERDALALLRDGDTDEALSVYERHGRVRVGNRADEMVDQLVRDWHATNDPHGSLMIAHYRADVRELNGRARAVMRASGRLGYDELVVGGGRLSTGDHVIVKRNSSRLDVRNGERGVIEALDRSAGALTVRFPERAVELDAAFLTQTTFGGRPTLEHGYAITAHAAQGTTCRHALVLARDDTYREWVYTTMSRATVANRLYVIADRSRGRDEFAPAEPARDGRALLAAALTRTRAEELALEQLHLDRRMGQGLER